MPVNFEGRFLGYDIRLASDEYGLEMDEATRRHYFLKPDVTWQISTDINIWPSIFVDEVSLEMFLRYFKYYNRTDYIVIDDLENPMDLFEDRDDMLEKYRKSGIKSKGVIIGVEGFFEPTTLDYEESFYINIWPQIIGEVPADWEFLGFDIAEEQGLSGLVNCGYTEAEFEELAPVWTPKLNEYGLFSKLEDAKEFAKITDNRVEEHGPFLIFGIYRDPVVLEPK